MNADETPQEQGRRAQHRHSDGRAVMDIPTSLREEVAAALPDALMPVGAGLKYPERMYHNRNTAAERLTGYGTQLVDALMPAISVAYEKGRADALAERAESGGDA